MKNSFRASLLLGSALLLAGAATLTYSPAREAQPAGGGPGDSARIEYRYDGQGRLTDVRYGDGAAYRYRYDAAGNVLVAEVGRMGSAAVEGPIDGE